jgi:hypothetical protein
MSEGNAKSSGAEAMTNKTELVSVPRELLSRIAATFMFSLRDCDYKAICEILAAPPEDVRAVVEEPLALGWTRGDYQMNQAATTYDPSTADEWVRAGYPVEPIYRHPQRQMVLPDMVLWSGIAPIDVRNQIKGWNACLDEISRLNK